MICISILPLTDTGATGREINAIAESAHVSYGDATYTLVPPETVLEALELAGGDTIKRARATEIAERVRATNAEYIAFPA